MMNKLVIFIASVVCSLVLGSCSTEERDVDTSHLAYIEIDSNVPEVFVTYTGATRQFYCQSKEVTVRVKRGDFITAVVDPMLGTPTGSGMIRIYIDGVQVAYGGDKIVYLVN